VFERGRRKEIEYNQPFSVCSSRRPACLSGGRGEQDVTQNPSGRQLLAGIVVSPGLSQSNSNVKPVSPALAATPSAGDYSKEAFVIEKSYTRISEESDGTGIRERTAAVKILSDSGVKAFGVLAFSLHQRQ
jgi:hypothetical protein